MFINNSHIIIYRPATLEAGFTFEAMYEGNTFTVVVPDGGVSKGQRFIVPFTPTTVPVAIPVNGQVQNNTTQNRGGSIPIGIWRDGLCDCCAYGCCHVHLFMTTCFRSCLIGQILTRMKMTWLGKRTRDETTGNLNDSRVETDDSWKNTFRNIVIVTILFCGINILTATPTGMEDGMDIKTVGNMDETPNYESLSDSDKLKITINSWMSTLFGFYIFYIIVQLRATLRHVYSIPEQSCLFWYQLGICGNNPREGICGSGKGSKLCTAGVPIGWEDVCCAIWCQCCVAAQMARHTADYSQKKAMCCNSVGVLQWDDDEAYAGVQEGVGEGSVLIV